MPELKQTPIKRQVAVKVNIKAIANGRYVKEEGWQPNYIESPDGSKISRVNVIGTVVLKSDEETFNYKSFIIDDGTGKISVRSFEKDVKFEFDIGDVVLIIGRPREFNNEKYFIPEIIKKIHNPKWIELRNLELKGKFDSPVESKTSDRLEETNKPPINEADDKEIAEESDSDIIYNLIKKMDKGEGVPIDDIIKDSKIWNTEKILNSFLESGNIFEVKSGVVKVLE